MVALGLLVHRHHTTRFDSRALTYLYRHVTGVWVRVTIDAATPANAVVVLAVVLVVALRARRPRLAVVTLIAPALAECLTEFVAKPWVGRPYGHSVSLAFPSGHETFVASAAVVVLVAAAQVRGHRTARALLAGVCVLWTAVAGVGLVVNFWHYATDVLGAVALSVAVVLGVALATDLGAERSSRRASTGPRGRRASTPRAPA